MKKTREIGGNMFSRLLNSNIGYLVYTIFVLAIGAGSLVFFYFMVTGFNIGVYSENTLVGSVYVGGLTESEAEEKVRDSVNRWLDDEDITFEAGYQGYYYTFDRDLITFDIGASMDDARDGRANDLYVSYSPTALDTIDMEITQMDFMEGRRDLFDLDALIDDVLEDASMLTEWSRHEFSDYFVNEEEVITTLQDVTMPVVHSVNAEDLIEKIEGDFENGRVTLSPGESFSVLDNFGPHYTSSELDMVGSIMQDLLVPTCIQIQERHYNPQIDFTRYSIDNYPYFGRNVRVNRRVDYDFVVENDCSMNYEVRFSAQDENTLRAQFIGAPYLDDVVVTKEQIPVPEDGMIVIVTREIYNIYGEKIDDFVVVFEYYPPVD